MCSGQLPQGGRGPLRPGFLDVAHQRVEDDDGEDRQGLVRHCRVALLQPDHGGNHRRGEQQKHQHVGELIEELQPLRKRRRRIQFVAAIVRQAPRRLCQAEAGQRLRLQGGDDLFGSLPIWLIDGRVGGCDGHAATIGI